MYKFVSHNLLRRVFITSCSFVLFFLFSLFACLFLLVAAMLIQCLDTELLYYFRLSASMSHSFFHCFEGSFPWTIS